MKKLIILFLLLFSFSVISSEKENILFENDIYRLSLDSSGNCSKLNLFNKKDTYMMKMEEWMHIISEMDAMVSMANFRYNHQIGRASCRERV